MNVRDRILAACGGDFEHARYVEELLSWGRARRADAHRRRAAASVAPAEQLCERCKSSTGFEEETGFCTECSHITPRKYDRGPRHDLSEPGRGPQKETS